MGAGVWGLNEGGSPMISMCPKDDPTQSEEIIETEETIFSPD
jgi:hypothetical protein